jgi:hypothetical protein
MENTKIIRNVQVFQGTEHSKITDYISTAHQHWGNQGIAKVESAITPQGEKAPLITVVVSFY